jgi:uncharacterized membrane protein
MAERRAPLALHTEVQEEDRVWLALSYFGPLALLPLQSKSVPRYIKFHARQGLGLFVLFAIAFVLSLIPLIGPLVWLVAALAYLTATIVAFRRALAGTYWRVPIAAMLIDLFSKEPQAPGQIGRRDDDEPK